MKTANLPKFDWERIDEGNCGHTCQEWGTEKQTLEDKKEKKQGRIRIIEAYTVLGF